MRGREGKRKGGREREGNEREGNEGTNLPKPSYPLGFRDKGTRARVGAGGTQGGQSETVSSQKGLAWCVYTSTCPPTERAELTSMARTSDEDGLENSALDAFFAPPGYQPSSRYCRTRTAAPAMNPAATCGAAGCHGVMVSGGQSQGQGENGDGQDSRMRWTTLPGSRWWRALES